MNSRKKRISAIILCCLLVFIAVASPFFCVLLTGVLLPSQYSETYYGELSEMYNKLKTADSKKIIVLGNSNVAFGVDSALAEGLLNEAGIDYSVCNFGLYGALGTKMMCELALPQIKKDDIVIFTPELFSQSLSTYFSSEEAWYALDGDMKMFNEFSSETKSLLAGGYVGYTAKKLSLYNNGNAAQGSGVYAKSSFDGNCDLKNYPRKYNVMAEGYDSDTPITFDNCLFSADFVSYINGFAEKISKKGARIFYSFAPMNASAITVNEAAKADSFYAFLDGVLGFKIISNINDYVMESEWFYDSNYHLNESGMAVRTVKLVNDIKTELGNSSKTECALPEKPVVPDKEVSGEGDNSHSDMFEYRLDGNYYTVVGLTEEGKTATYLTVPYQVDGIYIKAFLPQVFSDNKNIEKITIQENIRTLSNGSFSGCENLKSIVLKHSEPADISVGYELLAGAGNCVICVPQSALSKFENNYFWSRYAKRLQGY